MRFGFSNPVIWLWLVPITLGVTGVMAARLELLKWQESATLGLSAMAAFFALLGARKQLARPRLSLVLSSAHKSQKGKLRVIVQDEIVVLQPILMNRGDQIAQRMYVQLIFPAELEPTVRAELYQPQGGMIREIAPSLRPDGEHPGVLGGWIDTTVFPDQS